MFKKIGSSAGVLKLIMEQELAQSDSSEAVGGTFIHGGIKIGEFTGIGEVAVKIVFIIICG